MFEEIPPLGSVFHDNIFFNTTHARRLLGSFKRCHTNLARRAWLNSLMSLKPKPPKALGLVNLSQATQHIFFFSSTPSHQNLVNTYYIILHMLTDRKKQDIVYVGIALSTDLSMVKFPARESLFVDHLIAFCLILSTMEVNRYFFCYQSVPETPNTFLDLSLLWSPTIT